MTMRRSIQTACVVLLAAAAGWLAHDRWARAPGAEAQPAAAGPCPGGAQPSYWKAPMDPTYIRNEPGKSPMGMDLVPVCPGSAEAQPTGTVSIDPAMVQSMGVRSAVVGHRDLARRIRTVGRVTYDERRVAHVHTKVQGWVERLRVEYEGQAVRRGQPLLEIYSPELVSTQEELLVAARYRDATRQSPFPDVSRGGDALFEATRRRLELWDIREQDIEHLLESGEIHKTLTLYAPTSGVVTHMTVRDGMEVAPNDNLYTIADLSRVWVHADVYEYELPWVAASQRAAVELSYMPGVRFEGEVTYVYPFLDPKSRTARIRIELANPEGTLKPDMYANVTIETEIRPQVLAIPEEAVIRSGTRSLAIVALGDGRFEPRDVELGIDSGDGWLEVREGLRHGERVVTSGQFLIDSESKLQEAVQKILAQEPAAGTPPPEHDRAHDAHAMPAGEHDRAHDAHAMPAGDHDRAPGTHVHPPSAPVEE
ncbi:MAG: efflux RND transporter periplasmic adaptor subunit [Deltaproteobacteria bacterium]|nr:MAG: efflux RND transporter periplasmic adaptor subunit [Deltaproteobacteria bacterium]